MTARSIRRALERKQKNFAGKAAQRESLAAAAAPISTGICFEPLEETQTISPAGLAANRANASLSTGPRTQEGKAKSSLNGVKAGLTGRTVLLSTDDAAEYARHLSAFEDEYKPVGLRECELVQSIADTFWRVARIPALEMAFFAKARIEFAELFEQDDPDARPHLIDAHTFLVYEKQIRNLQIQEARLVRRREKETAELRILQTERTGRSVPVVPAEDAARQKENEAATSAVKLNRPANGFEFSTVQIESHAQSARPVIAGQENLSREPNGEILAHRAA